MLFIYIKCGKPPRLGALIHPRFRIDVTIPILFVPHHIFELVVHRACDVVYGSQNRLKLIIPIFSHTPYASRLKRYARRMPAETTFTTEIHIEIIRNKI